MTPKREEVSEGKIVVLQYFSFLLSVDEVVGKVKITKFITENSSLLPDYTCTMN